MNEREIARIARVALDESADRLPARHARRLAAAREAALAQARTEEEKSPHLVYAALRTARRNETEPADPPAPRLLWRIAAVVVPIAVVTAGLLGISALDAQRRADDLAELDAAMLADEVPISAYADRGFGVYLRNAAWHAKADAE